MTTTVNKVLGFEFGEAQYIAVSLYGLRMTITPEGGLVCVLGFGAIAPKEILFGKGQRSLVETEYFFLFEVPSAQDVHDLIIQEAKDAATFSGQDWDLFGNCWRNDQQHDLPEESYLHIVDEDYLTWCKEHHVKPLYHKSGTVSR
jgi:hypothetical protein